MDRRERKKLRALPGVYRPRRDTELLIAAALRVDRPPGRALDLCTGTGAAALALARVGHQVTAVDLGRRATVTARWNAARAGVPLRVHRGHLFNPVQQERFSLIVSNPPYVPHPPGTRMRRHERAWNAGPDGRAILDELCDELADHLTPGGDAFLIQSSYAEVHVTLRALIERGLRTRIVTRERGELGPIARGRAAHLASLGHSTSHEDLVVIRATAPAITNAASGAAGAAPAEPVAR